MAFFTTYPWLLALFTNIDQKTLVDINTGNALQPLQFTNGDSLKGYLYLVNQPGGVGTAFNYFMPVLAGSSIGLTDGMGIHYADATGLALVGPGYQGASVITFGLSVNSAPLTSALAGVKQIQAVFEARCAIEGGTNPDHIVIVTNDLVIINNTSLYP